MGNAYRDPKPLFDNRENLDSLDLENQQMQPTFDEFEPHANLCSRFSGEGASLVPKDLKLDHDGFFQETFRLKRIARAFLKKVLPKEAIQHLDLKRLSVESRHLTDEMFKKREADVVYRVQSRERRSTSTS